MEIKNIGEYAVTLQGAQLINPGETVAVSDHYAENANIQKLEAAGYITVDRVGAAEAPPAAPPARKRRDVGKDKDDEAAAG